ncbi:MAG: hypothetical protein BroJett010_26100 [Gammaproteobacteria bacterium]|nr:MAG: hypothetical protein BroJett010_26100 [Gammaproteobacteria bacterium]
MEPRELQCLLGALYGIEVAADVRDFLVTDRRALTPWQADGTGRDAPEELLIEEGGQELGVALYLDAALLQRLSTLEPRDLLCGRNLADYCTAIEGISHFNYVAWNAARECQVTLLELEMQAEVDKYASARLLLSRLDGAGSAAQLLPRLFAGAAFDPALAPATLRRYEDAWGLAARYCLSLQSRYPAGAPAGAMLRELRQFFRAPRPAKVSHIHAVVLAS